MDAISSGVVRVARILAPVTVLGPGRRLALWVQGCGLACPGCASRDTWDPLGGRSVPVDTLVDVLADTLVHEGLGGLTITGGEPTDQPRVLASTVTRLREMIPTLDVLVFTGRSWKAARHLAPELMAAADCVVAGPYRADLPQPEHRLVATSNQELVITERARNRYLEWLDEPAATRLQVLTEGGALYLVGMPAPGDLNRFREALAARGVLLSGVSW